jgi:hypothetical protein
LLPGVWLKTASVFKLASDNNVHQTTKIARIEPMPGRLPRTGSDP